jgi:hypothetical protein
MCCPLHRDVMSAGLQATIPAIQFVPDGFLRHTGISLALLPPQFKSSIITLRTQQGYLHLFPPFKKGKVKCYFCFMFQSYGDV